MEPIPVAVMMTHFRHFANTTLHVSLMNSTEAALASIRGNRCVPDLFSNSSHYNNNLFSIDDIGGKVWHDDTTTRCPTLVTACGAGQDHTVASDTETTSCTYRHDDYTTVRFLIVLGSIDTPLGRQRRHRSCILAAETDEFLGLLLVIQHTPQWGGSGCRREAHEFYELLLLIQHTPQWGGSGCSNGG
eukprot:6492656-Amphidinium_carterae.2